MSQVRDVSEEDSFVDLDFPLAAYSRDAASEIVHIGASGQFEGHLIGFTLELHPEWKPKLLENADATFYWGTVAIRSLGQSSDAFVALLVRKYGLPGPARPMLSEIHAQAVGLNTDPRQLEGCPAKMKLFFHSEIEDRYAEVYINVDLEAKVVQFHEKDPEYRVNLVRALTEDALPNHEPES